jgi:uncharacterized protein YjiS (DUF1127 family)
MTTTTFKYQHQDQFATPRQILTRVWNTLSLWSNRAQQRTQLAELSWEQLEDIGITRESARAEAAKPFWI